MDQISLLIIFLLSVLYLPIVQQLAKGWKMEEETIGWTLNIKESKKVGGRSVSSK